MGDWTFFPFFLRMMGVNLGGQQHGSVDLLLDIGQGEIRGKNLRARLPSNFNSSGLAFHASLCPPQSPGPQVDLVSWYLRR